MKEKIWIDYNVLVEVSLRGTEKRLGREEDSLWLQPILWLKWWLVIKLFICLLIYSAFLRDNWQIERMYLRWTTWCFDIRIPCIMVSTITPINISIFPNSYHYMCLCVCVCVSVWTLKIYTTIWSSNLTSGYISKEYEIVMSKKYLHSHMYYSIIHTSQNMETT